MRFVARIQRKKSCGSLEKTQKTKGTRYRREKKCAL
jgi:hypothetical protein